MPLRAALLEPVPRNTAAALTLAALAALEPLHGVHIGARIKVKRIRVKPGASLGLPKHTHRAEHAIVVKGTNEISCAAQVHLLNKNQSTFTALGQLHRLAEPGTLALEITKVQSGSYLLEDDRVGCDDTCGRACWPSMLAARNSLQMRSGSP